MIEKADFDQQNEEKFRIHSKKDKRNFRAYAGEIRFTKLWINIWYEENGKKGFRRPVLVIRKVWNLFYVIPLSTKVKDNKYYYKLKSVNFDKPSSAMLSQAKNIDKKRFMKSIWKVSKDELQEIKKLLRDMYLPEV